MVEGIVVVDGAEGAEVVGGAVVVTGAVGAGAGAAAACTAGGTVTVSHRRSLLSPVPETLMA